MKILCGTDFTPNSHDAARVASAWARRFKDTLVLAHVVQRPAVKGLDETVWEGYLAPFREELAQHAERLTQEGTTVKTELRVGGAGEELTALAGRKGTRLNVVSSVGRIAVSRLLVGSVAERIAESSPVPTLVVRKPAPLIGWGEGRRPLEILVAADFSPTTEAALGWVREFQAAGDCEVTVAYIDWPPRERSRLGVTGSVTLGDNPPEVQSALERDLTEHARQFLGDSARVVVVASWGRPAVKTVELATDSGADLIVTGAHQVHGLRRLWHSSFSRVLLHDSPTNVVVVPAAAGAASAAVPIPTVSRVLVTTDFSALGNRAVAKACAILPPGGTIRLLHVLPPRQTPNPLIGGRTQGRLQTKADHERARRDVERKLQALVPTDAAARFLQAEFEVVEAENTADAIHHAAERFGAHVICLSSHGRSGVSRALLGSVAGEVMKRSRRSVLVVRDEVE